jgi:hypothetical protein
MQDLFDAIRKSIEDYVNVEELPIRDQRRIRGVYDKFTYNYDVVDNLVEMPTQKKSKGKKTDEPK